MADQSSQLTGQQLEFNELVQQKTYDQQAAFFLNAFWEEFGRENAEQIWKWVEIMKIISNDTKKSTDHSLDEICAARFLEKTGNTMTVIARRNMLREIDIDNDNMMSLFEYLLSIDECKAISCINLNELLTRPQGTNEEVEKANAQLEKITKYIDSIKAKIAKCEKQIAEFEEMDNPPVVKYNRARNQLAQLLDNYPNVDLNRDRLTAEAAVRKAKRSDVTSCPGSIWWQNRIIKEADSYKPKKNLRRVLTFHPLRNRLV